MAEVTGFTADRMRIIENTTVVDGEVQGNNLILITREGTPIDAGDVRGPVGPMGPIGTGVPLGTIIDFYGATAPAEYLECNGGAFDPLAFPDLNTHLGGNTLPDLRDRSTIGRTATVSNGGVKGVANSSVPEHQHANSFQVPAHGHTAGADAQGQHGHNWGHGTTWTFINSGSGLGYPITGNPGNGFWDPMLRATWLHDGNHVHNITVNAAGAMNPTGSVGNVSGATPAISGSNYHPVMAVIKCIKATL